MYYKALAFFGIFFVSCSSVTQYPSWYVSTNDDTSYLYGVGSSSNLQDAKFEALNDIASQISLSVESDISVSKEYSNDHFSSSTNSSIGVNVSDIELDSLEYPLIDEIDKTFFVQARIKKDIVISKLNTNINLYVVDINSIVDSIKNSRCRTLSPKHRYDLSLFMSKINLYSKQIRALQGVVSNQEVIDSINEFLQHKPIAYYVSFAQGGKGDDYSLIEASLLSEYNKFFDIQDKDSSIYYIENRYKITRMASSAGIMLNASIKDCNGSTIFNTSIEASQDSRDINPVIDRLKAQLYKKIKSWVENK